MSERATGKLPPEPAPLKPAPLPLAVDPTAVTVAGRPVADASYWLCQGGPGVCAPAMVAIVLAEVLGVPLHSNAEVKVRALSLDLIGFDLHPARVPGAEGPGPRQGWTGMSAADVAALCRSYGVALDVRSATPSELATRLDDGAAVVVALDTEQLRVGACDGTLPGLGLQGHHALVLTGLDATAGLAYLNSPVDPAGTGVVIPLDQFAGAWAQAGNAVLETDLPDGGAGLGSWSPGQVAPADPWAGLPETVDVAALVAGTAGKRARRRLLWLPFPFLARTADPVG